MEYRHPRSDSPRRRTARPHAQCHRTSPEGSCAERSRVHFEDEDHAAVPPTNKFWTAIAAGRRLHHTDPARAIHQKSLRQNPATSLFARPASSPSRPPTSKSSSRDGTSRPSSWPGSAPAASSFPPSLKRPTPTTASVSLGRGRRSKLRGSQCAHRARLPEPGRRHHDGRVPEPPCQPRQPRQPRQLTLAERGAFIVMN
jgi:hypothetical protein